MRSPVMTYLTYLAVWAFFSKFAKEMKTSSLIGFLLLLVVWIWLAIQLLSTGGINLKNILILAMSGIICFVPLMRKLREKQNGNNSRPE